MSVIDAILNIAGLLLWLKWRDKGQESGPRISLIGTLKVAGVRHRQVWFLFALLSLLVLRPLVYRWLGATVEWIPTVSLGVIVLPFRSDAFLKMFFFSFLSFAVALGIFYLCLLLLSCLRDRSVSDPMQIVIRSQLGKLDLLPSILKLVLPWLVTLILWMILAKPLTALGILPSPKSFVHLAEQGVVIGASAYLVWEYLIVAILLLHLLNSYIYFGAWSFWIFIDNAARQILKLISWIPLRVGKVDFAPLVAMALVILAAKYGSRGLVWVYQRLPI